MEGQQNSSLTLKEKRFVSYWTELGNGTQAVKKAGYRVANDNVAANLAWRLLRKAKIKTSVSEKLNVFGITEEYRYERLKTILEGSNQSLVLRALELLWKIDGTTISASKYIEDTPLPVPIMAGTSKV